MRSRKRKYMSSRLVIIVVIIALCMGIGYATISTTLNIDGTSDIDSASWDIHFNNIQVTTGSVTAATPTISNNTTVSFTANLANPGDFYEFKVDVVNAGTLDAKLDAITILPVLTQAQSNYFKYTVTYEDGIDISQNDSLNAGVTETLLIRCEFLVLSDTSLYPTDDVSFNFSVAMTYIQGYGNQIRTTIYNISSTSFTIGSNVPTGVTTYDNYSDAVTAFGHPFFLKHTVSNNLITSSYVGFVLNDTVYYLRGAGATYNATGDYYNNDSPYYEANKAILQTAFGSSNCSEYVDDDFKSYSCSDSASGVYAYASTRGNVDARGGGSICHVDSGGYSPCVDD